MHIKDATPNYNMQKVIYCTVILLLSFSLLALSAPRGSITGIILDDQKVALPGVQIILSDTSVPPKKAVRYSEANGSFEFNELEAGLYLLTAELSGFETLELKQLKVEPGRALKLEIILQLKLSTSETITVIPEKPILNPHVTTTPQEISQTDISSAPIKAKRFQEVLPLIPSVVRGPDGQINMNGARASENSLLVNGSNVTDPVTGEFAMEIPVEAIQNVQTFTNSYSAEYGKYRGGVVNISTLPGDNKWKIKFNDFIPRIRFIDNSPAGLASLTPRLVVSGPLIPSKLFISQSLNYNFVRTTLFDLKVPDNETIYRNFNSLTQLDYIINSHNRLTYTLSFFPQEISNFGLNQFRLPETSPNQEQFGWNMGLYLKNTSDKGALSETIVSIKKFDSRIVPDTELPMYITPEGLNGNYFNRQSRNSYRYVFLHNYTFPLYDFKGDHITKAGTEIDYVTYSGKNESYPVTIMREDRSLSRIITFSGPTDIGQHTTELTLFIQDSWTISSKITADLGIRLDKNFLLSGTYVEPRIAVVFTPFNSKTTILRGGIGTFYDKFLLNAPDFLKFQTRTEYFYSSTDDPYSITYNPRLFNKLKLPYSLTFNLEIDQQIVKNLILRINYMHRKGSDELIVEPETHSAGQAYLTLSNRGRSLYKAIEFILRYDFHKNFIIFSYIRSKTEGNLNNFSSLFGYLQEPIIQPDYYSLLPSDNPDRVLMWGIFRLPYGVTFSPLFEFHTGFPYTTVDENQNYAGKINGYRFRDFIQMDIRLTKNIKIKKYTIQVGFKIYNLLNRFNPRDVNNNISSPYFGQFYNHVMTRQIRGVFEILY